MLIDALAVACLTGIACVTLGMGAFGAAMPALMLWGMAVEGRPGRRAGIRSLSTERAHAAEAPRSAA